MLLSICGEPRKVDDALWATLEGPRPHEGWYCNGCTASPDYLPGTGEPIWIACAIHDYHYSPGCTPVVPKGTADAIFRRNIRRVLKHYRVPLIRRTYISTIYWAAVALLGKKAYHGGEYTQGVAA